VKKIENGKGTQRAAVRSSRDAQNRIFYRIPRKKKLALECCFSFAPKRDTSPATSIWNQCSAYFLLMESSHLNVLLAHGDLMIDFLGIVFVTDIDFQLEYLSICGNLCNESGI
jgi:hypothetical protein